MEHTDKDDSVSSRAIEQNEAMEVPTPEVGGQLGTGSAYGGVAGEDAEFLIEEPEDHFGILRAGLSDVVFDGDVILPALPGLQNAGHVFASWPALRCGGRDLQR